MNAEHCDIGERFGIVGIEAEGQLRLGNEALVLTAKEMHDGEPATRIGVLRIEAGCRERMHQGTPDRV